MGGTGEGFFFSGLEGTKESSVFFKKITTTTTSVARNRRRRPLAALRAGGSALKASQSGAQGGWLRWLGASVAALWSCGRVSHDICALTSMGGFHCFQRAEGGKSAEERL